MTERSKDAELLAELEGTKSTERTREDVAREVLGIASPDITDETPIASVKGTKPESGMLVIRYAKSIIERDEHGRMLRIIGDGTTHTLKRNEAGQVIEITEETEEEIPAADDESTGHEVEDAITE